MDSPASREKWNRRYSEASFRPFPERPGEWLAENRELLAGRPRPPGGEHASRPRALDVACGDGRNSRYLADLGFAVEAIDVSDVAIDALRAAAAQDDLAVSARVVDLEAAGLPAGEYDVVVNLNYLQRTLFGSLATALRPGGLLVFETFTQAHVLELGNHFDPDFLLEPNELLRAFPQLCVRHYREGVAERSGRPRGLASIVAQRLTVA